ncbi:MAG: ATP-binding protein [Chloroflexi bacterium]|nr:ATP-binding protein [Chloroflexota bacterium]
MAIHESSINYENLIRDLAEMYPFDIAEVVFVELVANSLDAKPTRVSIDFDPHKKILCVADDGKGMTASDFEQYHDFAAGLKTRGSGIGFAGVGAKVSFNVATRVITETRSGSFAGGSNWYLQSKRRLVWEDIPPVHLHGHGTRVEVQFTQDARLGYSSANDLVKLLRRHYLPLLDKKFLLLYEALGHYSSNLRFVVNGAVIEPGSLVDDFDLGNVREFFPQKASRRIGYGVLGLAFSEYPLGANLCGVLLCTFGKIIKADLFNQFPGNIGTRILGLVEIPAFVNFLTTAKTDFIRREKHREFESLYNPIRQEFKTWLGELGLQPAEVTGTDEATKLERELKRISDDVPELAEFFGFRMGKTILQKDSGGAIKASLQEGSEVTFPVGEGEAGEGLGPVDVGEQPGQALVEDKKAGTEPAKPISRVGRRGPKIGFAEAPDRVDLAWVDGNSVVINSGHPSYVKVRSDTAARRLHSLFAIASAIQRFVASGGGAQDLMFTDRMMAAWGKK